MMLLTSFTFRRKASRSTSATRDPLSRNRCPSLLGRRSLREMIRHLFERFALPDVVQDLTGLVAETFPLCRTGASGQREEDHAEMDRLRALVGFPVGLVIFPDFLVADDDLAADLPPDEPLPVMFSRMSSLYCSSVAPSLARFLRRSSRVIFCLLIMSRMAALISSSLTAIPAFFDSSSMSLLLISRLRVASRASARIWSLFGPL